MRVFWSLCCVKLSFWYLFIDVWCRFGLSFCEVLSRSVWVWLICILMFLLLCLGWIFCIRLLCGRRILRGLVMLRLRWGLRYGVVVGSFGYRKVLGGFGMVVFVFYFGEEEVLFMVFGVLWVIIICCLWRCGFWVLKWYWVLSWFRMICILWIF